jgi:4-hydroxybenzoate polyprenyltransferase
MASDIQTGRLVFRLAPPRLHPYIKLARLDRPIGTWLLLFPCWWSLTLAAGGVAHMDARGWGLMMLFAAGAVLMRAAGCTVNDLWDRDLDAKVARTRTRPLPAGDITVRGALLFLAALLSLSLCILLILNGAAILLGLLSLALVAAYPLMKRVTWWPQLFLGFTFNWGALMGWAALRGGLPLHTESAPLWLYAGGIFWTLAYDTIYAHQDREDDALVGVKSTARLFGRHSKPFVAGFFLLAILCFGIAKYFGAYSGLTPVFIVLAVLHAFWQVRSWDMGSPESCLKTFRANALFGWLVLGMMAF